MFALLFKASFARVRLSNQVGMVDGVVTNKQGTTLYTEPISGQKITTIPYGEKILVQQNDEKYGMYKVYWHVGYVMQGAIEFKEDESVGNKIAQYAESKIGCTYVFGTAGPNTFDSIGLVYWAHKQVGISLPRNEEALAKYPNKKFINFDKVARGDVCQDRSGFTIVAGVDDDTKIKFIRAVYGETVKLTSCYMANLNKQTTKFVRFW